jgi:2-dehydropantoate 2-reductase
VKSQDTDMVLRHLRSVAPPDLLVFCIQNGIENERAALRLFERVYGGFVFVPASHLIPGVVVSEAGEITGVIDVGRYPRGTDEVAQNLALILNSSGFSSRAVGDVMRWKRAKLAANVGNAVSGLDFSDEVAETVRRLASTEARACLLAAGLAAASEAEVAERRAGVSAARVSVRDAPSGNSTWQSLRRGSATVETDYLNGEVVLLGRLHGIATPVNEALQSAIRDLLTGRSVSETRAALLGRVAAVGADVSLGTA